MQIFVKIIVFVILLALVSFVFATLARVCPPEAARCAENRAFARGSCAFS